MSLEEFLGDDSLGDSVWNEDDINLDAINNTTSIEVLKNTTSRDNLSPSASHYTLHGDSRSPRTTSLHANENKFSSPLFQKPPYIVKFSNLPPKFADTDIEELFQAKYTKFIKFKLFWEININPTIETIKSGSIFDQNFIKDSKVAFVELYTSRDLNKVLTYWSKPLKEIYQIDVEPAEFSNFKEYISRNETVPLQANMNPSKPYFTPKPKPNPFGAAKPVDTQSKIIDIEGKMEKLHVEDTKTLRKYSKGEALPIEQKPKITLLKKAPMSYSQVLQKSVEEAKKSSSNSLNTTPTPPIHSPSEVKQEEKSEVNSEIQEEKEDDKLGEQEEQNLEDAEGAAQAFTFKNAKRENSSQPPYHKSYRGRGGSRGSSRRGTNRGNFRGGRKFSNYNNGANQQNSNSGNQGSKNDQETYSLFKPASDFLNDKADSNTKQNNNIHRGNSSSRGGYRGGYRRY
ncbi:hypothetical protein KAFR_0C05500 [Kazachstania africana CBS 2517]|uniref:Uncharacterized protein n=1 Tax=Kazachstania africana (strain ATCC 22294 / BCRC 22015 / CBS 2517 / CECT 1963 / NBRC 1671 / NRRL Y-8276) TaxID=1071382 RepID=H2AT41_KAZAF|nr:hypothetical protein KAFR_0C05500 [Kazachstania africana CBS 2517]CCF57541.1 hypothetical protein KAFR_0C05500 [Kazachstania africana CBS 2517]